jgi:hypothetical protein
MQIKKGHFIIILAVGFILANILIALRQKPVVPVVVSTEVNSASDMQAIKEENSLVSSSSGNSSPGVIIFAAKNISKEIVTEKKSEESIVSERAKAVAAAKRSSASASSEPVQAVSTLTPAGITVSGKQPSQKKQEELNARGIVLY